MSSKQLKRLQDYIRWIPFLFITSLISFAYIVVLQARVIYTLRQKHEYFTFIFNFMLINILSGLTMWSFFVAVFKNPGVPMGVRRNDDQERISSSSHQPSETRWSKRERLREERVGITSGEQDQDDGEGERDEGSDDETPLLTSAAKNRSFREDPTTTALDGGAGFVPGQPKMPSRTERAQLDDVVGVIERAQNEGQTSRSGKVVLGGLQVKNTGEKRWCNKCDCEKPDRAHHCSVCGVCILRMDHHCPWLASTCVGLRNHKAFFLFLCYTALLCAYSCGSMASILMRYVEEEPDVSTSFLR